MDALTYAVQLQGPSVPPDLRDKWFRIEVIRDGRVTLSVPYLDADLTQPAPPWEHRF